MVDETNKADPYVWLSCPWCHLPPERRLATAVVQLSNAWLRVLNHKSIISNRPHKLKLCNRSPTEPFKIIACMCMSARLEGSPIQCTSPEHSLWRVLVRRAPVKSMRLSHTLHPNKFIPHTIRTAWKARLCWLECSTWLAMSAVQASNVCSASEDIAMTASCHIGRVMSNAVWSF